MSSTFQHEGHYVCECGREFTKAQSYNAHLSHCKEHLSEDKYEKRLEHQRVASASGNEVRKELCKQRRSNKDLIQQQQWEQTSHYCETCGKELPSEFKKIFGTGRFCSLTCANTHELSLDTKKKIALNTSVTPWHCKRSLNGYYKGIYCASSYELIYLVYMFDHNVDINRCTITFEYSYNNKDHIYIPDFFIEKDNLIIEIKGKWSEEVDIKANSVIGYDYKILYEKDLKDYWLYCKETYHVNRYRQLCELLYEPKK